MNFNFTKIKENLTSFHWWLGWLGIVLGSTILAIGFVYFINPYNIIPGGVYGASIVLHNLFPQIQVGTFGYMFDIPLFCLAMLLLGANLGTRTLVSSMLTPAIMNALTYISYPTKEAIHNLDPTQLLGGHINMTDDLMLTTLIGATLIGLGCGIVVRSEATTGGSDIVAMILQKYAHIRFSTAVMLVDACVVLFGLIVLCLGFGNAGKGTESWLLSFYSLLAIFISSRVIAYVINGNKDDKLLFIISDKSLSELHRFILEDLERTATIIKSQGLYTQKDKNMIFLVVTKKEVSRVNQIIKKADPTAFVVITDAYETMGEGWRPLPDAHDIKVE